ncbi:glycosyltransferase family 9 protein [Rahnella sikkimica]|uniref:Heptosyltransferase n=1 Tax=Rahnella sikkimica TaxID=1805933 RepID=A0A2L1UZ30_9GAMM|nr:hypothetical protein [Rahnella sikkimica]AVF38141.1 hypothetical protein BV494_25010 [Rahnella sikkimica]
MQFLKSFNRNKNKFFREIKKKTLLSFLRTQRSRSSFELSKVRNILLLRLDDKIGDMVVTTGTAYLLAKQGYRVSVLTGPVCGQMLKNCDYLDHIIQYKNRMSLDALNAQNFDVIIDFDDVLDYERLSLAWRMKHSHHIGFNKNIPALYNPSISYLDAEKHITERRKRVLYFKRKNSLSVDIDPEKVSMLIQATDQMAVAFGEGYENLIACHWINIQHRHYSDIKDEIDRAHVREVLNHISLVSFLCDTRVRLSFKKKYLKLRMTRAL